MTNQIPVRIARAASEPPLGGDLFGWIDIVWDAVARDFATFDAVDTWDVWPIEIHLDHVIVQDVSRGRHFRANISVDTEREAVSFTDVERVVNQWIPADDGQVERGEAVEAPELATVLIDRKAKSTESKSVFRGALGALS